MIKGAVPYFLLAVLGAAAFAPAFGAGFTNWDDPLSVIDNPLIRSLEPSNIAGMFYGPHSILLGLYIPVTQLSFALDRAVFGEGPAAPHAVNVLLHLGAGLLLYAFLCGFLENRAAGFFGAAVFLVHPAQVESVAWIAERKSVLSGLFIFAALLAYLRRTRPGPRSFSLSAEWPVLLWTLMALLSKPIAVILPPVLAGLDLARAGGAAGMEIRSLPRAFFSKWPYFLMAIAASAATLFGHAASTGLAIAGRTVLGTLATMLSVVPAYVQLVLVPTSLTAIRIVPEPGALLAPAVLFGAAMLLATLVAMIRLSVRSRVAAFFSLWLVAAFLPVSNIVPIDIYIADRYLYLPIAALGAWSAHGICGVAGRAGGVRRRMAIFLGAAVLLLLAGLSFDRSRVWHSSESLWTDTIAISPASAKARANLGLLRLEQGKPEAAEALFREALSLRELADTWLNLGIALSEQSRHEEALGAFGSAKRLFPGLRDVDYWHGRMFSALGKLEASEAAYREEIRRRPDFVGAWIDLAFVQAKRGKLDDALASTEQAVMLDPGNAEALLNAGVLRWKVRRDSAGAREALEACMRSAGDPALVQRAKDFLRLINADGRGQP